MTFHTWRGSIMRVIFRGRCNIWWGWMVTRVAPLIVNNVSGATRINHDSHFPWQAQYLVRLDGQTCCSAQCKWRFKSCLPHIILWLFVAGVCHTTCNTHATQHATRHATRRKCWKNSGILRFCLFLKSQSKRNVLKAGRVSKWPKKKNPWVFSTFPACCVSCCMSCCMCVACVLHVVLHVVLHGKIYILPQPPRPSRPAVTESSCKRG